MEVPVEPLCELPVCMLCHKPLMEITHPILLPCTHYIVCFPCFRLGNAGPSRVKCPYCPRLHANSSPNPYLSHLCSQLHSTPTPSLPQLIESLKYQLAVYLLQYKETHPYDWNAIPIVDEPERECEEWDCWYCGELGNEGGRCRCCERVNFGKMQEKTGLTRDIQRIFDIKPEIEPKISQKDASLPLNNSENPKEPSFLLDESLGLENEAKNVDVKPISKSVSLEIEEKPPALTENEKEKPLRTAQITINQPKKKTCCAIQ